MIFTRERFKCHQGVMPIPCPHFKITIVKRGQGQSAVAGAAYQSGERLFSEYDQKTKFYNKKKELVHAEIMLPSHAPPGFADRATLWNAVEAVENQWNSQLARRIVLAFPVEVPKEQYLSMIHLIIHFRKHKTLDGCPELTPEQAEKLKADMAQSWHLDKSKPYPAYLLSNNNANIRRVRQRIEELSNRSEFAGWTFPGGEAKINEAENRLQLIFEEKPDADQRQELKSNGFK